MILWQLNMDIPLPGGKQRIRPINNVASFTATHFTTYKGATIPRSNHPDLKGGQALYKVFETEEDAAAHWRSTLLLAKQMYDDKLAEVKQQRARILAETRKHRKRFPYAYARPLS